MPIFRSFSCSDISDLSDSCSSSTLTRSFSDDYIFQYRSAERQSLLSCELTFTPIELCSIQSSEFLTTPQSLVDTNYLWPNMPENNQLNMESSLIAPRIITDFAVQSRTIGDSPSAGRSDSVSVNSNQTLPTTGLSATEEIFSSSSSLYEDSIFSQSFSTTESIYSVYSDHPSDFRDVESSAQASSNDYSRCYYRAVLSEFNGKNHRDIIRQGMENSIQVFLTRIDRMGGRSEFFLHHLIYNYMPCFLTARDAMASGQFSSVFQACVFNKGFSATEYSQSREILYNQLVALQPYLKFSTRNAERVYYDYLIFMATATHQEFLNCLVPVLLVGIETNPGPNDYCSNVNNYNHFLDENVELRDKYLLNFMFRMSKLQDVITTNVYCQLILFDESFRSNESKEAKVPKNVLTYLAWSYTQPDFESTIYGLEPPAAPLVGIETNPGPAVLSTLRSPRSNESEFVPQGWFNLGVDSTTVDSINNLAKGLESIAGSATKANIDVSLPLLDKLVQKFTDDTPSMKDCTKFCLVLAVIILGLSKKRLGSNTFTLIQLLLQAYIIKVYTVDDPVVALVTTLITALSTTSDGDVSICYEPQAGVADTIVSAILGYVYTTSFGGDFSTKSVAKFLKSLSDLPKLKDGAFLFVDGLLTITQKFLDYICDKANLDPIIVKQSMFPELDQVNTDLQKFIADLRAGAHYNYDNAMLLFEIEKRAANICASIPNTREMADHKRSALATIAAIKPLITKMERNNVVNNGPRREPLAIMLGGPTAVGKSTSILPLILAVNSLVLPDEKIESFKQNHNDHIWNFIPENPFADSYHGQFNTIIDEAGAQRDVAGTPDPGALGAMRMINTANFPLHMANLEDKGNTNFNSELVWSTTNRRTFDWKSMYLPEAYARRWKLSFLHVPKKEFCIDGTADGDLWNRRLDQSKIPYSDDGFVMSINEFHPYDFRPDRGVVTGPPISFDELIIKIATVYRKHKAHGDNLLSFQSKIKNQYVSMREDFKPQAGPSNLENCLDTFIENTPFSEDFIKSIFRGYQGIIEPTKEFFQDFNTYASSKLADCIPSKGFATVIYDFACSNKALLISLAMGLPIMIAAWKFIGPTMFPQNDSPGPTKQGKKASRPKGSRPKVHMFKHSSRSAQAGVNQNCLDIAKKVINSNLYSLKVVHADGDINLGFALFTHGRCFVIPEHFLYMLEDMIEEEMCNDNPILSFHRVGAIDTGFELAFKDMECTYVEDENDDIAYCIAPDVVHCHKDIRSLVSSSDNDLISSKFPGAMLRPANGGYSLVTSEMFPVGSTSYKGYSIESGFSYPIATKAGECGAPIILAGVSNMPIICGFHVAGNNVSGLATRFKRENFDQAFGLVTSVHNELILDPQSSVDMGPKFLVDSDVAKLRVPYYSNVVPSPLHNSWSTSLYKPAALKSFERDGVIYDPWVNARSKYSNFSKVVNLFTLDMVSQDTISTMIYAAKTEKPWDPRVYTFQEAVAGVPAVAYCDGISRKTSAGYPLNLSNILPGKQDYFGTGDSYEFTSIKCLELIESVQVDVELAAKGFRLNTLYADYLKDERRLASKVDIGKTRLISAAPLRSLILFRMYFGDLVRWMMDNRIFNSCAVGVNPYSHEWTAIARHLKSVGDKAIFGDYSGYDGSLSATFEYKFLDLAESYYHNATPEDRTIRRSLFEDVVNSRHVALSSDTTSVSYEWFGSNPSGNLLTTVLNSFCNILIIKYACVSCYAKSIDYDHLSIPRNFSSNFVQLMDDNLRCIVFGDDNGLVVSETFAEYIDQTKLTSAMSEIGYTYTDEAKGDEVHTFRSIEECSFLKRAFKKVNNIYQAPLQLDVILEMPYWTKKSAPSGSVEQTVDTALMELSLHGREIFNTYAPVINNACLDKLSYKPNINFAYRYNQAKHCEGWN